MSVPQPINQSTTIAFLTVVAGIANLTGVFSGWLLLLLFGILYAHIAASVPLIGFKTAWPLGFIFTWFKGKGF